MERIRGGDPSPARPRGPARLTPAASFQPWNPLDASLSTELGGQRVSVDVDAGHDEPAAPGITGTDGPECATAALGAAPAGHPRGGRHLPGRRIHLGGPDQSAGPCHFPCQARDPRHHPRVGQLPATSNRFVTNSPSPPASTASTRPRPASARTRFRCGDSGRGGCRPDGRNAPVRPRRLSTRFTQVAQRPDIGSTVPLLREGRWSPGVLCAVIRRQPGPAIHECPQPRGEGLRSWVRRDTV
jgi:hypothetical protein